MVQSHGQVTWQASSTQHDIQSLTLVWKTLIFSTVWLQMNVNWLILQLLNILLWILQKVQLVWSRIIGSSAILDFLNLELPVIHLCLQVSTSCQPYWFLHFILFSHFKLKWFETIWNQLELIQFVVGTLYFKHLPIDFNGNVKYF